MATGSTARATMAPPLDADDASFLAAARLRAARMQPYMSSAVFSLVPVPAPGSGTFAVDRWWRVYVDMGRARRWGVEATAAVLLHEANHVLRDHHRRAAECGATGHLHHLWNLAADAAINDDLVADGHPLPDPVLPVHLGAPDGRLEEGYFRLLRDRHVAAARSVACGSGSGGHALPVELEEDPSGDGAPDGLDDVDAAAVRRAVAHDISAAHAAGAAVSPGLARWAQAILTPQVNWRALLRSAVTRPVRAVTSRPHPTWRRPDRRADAAPDALRPGVRRERAEIAVVIDTSASMTPDLLDAAVTELDALVRRTGSGVTVVVCDARAAAPQRVRRIGSLRLMGGGGTDLRIGIDAAARVRPTPTLIVVLTDGLTPWPGAAPPRTSLVAVVIGDGAPLPSGPGITAIRIGDP